MHAHAHTRTPWFVCATMQMCDADLTMLSLGTDLTSLGLNLNSSESLHKALVSPLAEVPVKSECRRARSTLGMGGSCLTCLWASAQGGSRQMWRLSPSCSAACQQARMAHVWPARGLTRRTSAVCGARPSRALAGRQCALTRGHALRLMAPIFFRQFTCLYAAPEPEFELPACYKHIPQRLQPGYLTKFKEETLFYIFYR